MEIESTEFVRMETMPPNVKRLLPIALAALTAILAARSPRVQAAADSTPIESAQHHPDPGG